MATWQVHISLKKAVPDQTLSESFLNSLQVLSKVLPKEESWSANTMQYGKIDETCIEIDYEDDLILEIAVRLDLRTLSKKLLQAICDFASSNDLRISSKAGLIVPNLENLLLILQNSPAWRFVKNPVGFLQNISENNSH